MLGRAPMKVPETSLTKGLSKSSIVVVTLKAGETIQPHFPFSFAKEPLPGVLRRSGDSREKPGEQTHATNTIGDVPANRT